MAGRPRVLMAGGGTGGHIFPGVAVADRLRRRIPGAEVLLAATAKDRVSRHIAACPLEIVEIHSPKLPGNVVRVPGFTMLMARALMTSYSYLREMDPDVVIGLGGYGSVALVTAARSRRIPAIVMEQNAVPGKATRLLGRIGAVAASSFPGIHARGFRGRAVVTGNPIRPELLAARRAHMEFGLDPEVTTLGVLGGSLGARGLNWRVVAAIQALRDACRTPFQVLHATGSEDDESNAAQAYAKAGIRACVRPFFTGMASVYGSLDLAICRAGGTTVAELAALGIPAVFVPYPHHKDQHQRLNAEALVRRGAASVVDESALTPEALVAEVAPLLGDATRRERRAREMRRCGRPDAADRVVDLILELTGYVDDMDDARKAARMEVAS